MAKSQGILKVSELRMGHKYKSLTKEGIYLGRCKYLQLFDVKEDTKYITFYTKEKSSYCFLENDEGNFKITLNRRHRFREDLGESYINNDNIHSWFNSYHIGYPTVKLDRYVQEIHPLQVTPDLVECISHITVSDKFPQIAQLQKVIEERLSKRITIYR